MKREFRNVSRDHVSKALFAAARLHKRELPSAAVEQRPAEGGRSPQGYRAGSRMSWRDKANEDCDFCHVLYRDDGAPLGCLLPLHGGEVGAADSGG
jgi:hypothetical protein